MLPRLRAFALLSLVVVAGCAAGDSPCQDCKMPTFPSAGDFATLETRLRHGDGAGAQGLARSFLARPVPRESDAQTLYGRLLAELALAEALSGQEAAARWHWQAAHSLGLSRAESEELSRLGVAPQVAAWTVRDGMESPPAAGTDYQPAERLGSEMPRVSQAAKSLPGPKWLRLQLRIDAEGRPQEPVAQGPDSRFALEVLETVRGWRFEPARRAGVAVPDLYTTLINAPAETPLLGYLGTDPELLGFEAKLRAGDPAAALREGVGLWKDGVGSSTLSFDAGAKLLYLRGLASVAAGDEAEGLCFAQAAQGLLPALFDADLSAYGRIGSVVEAHRFGEERARTGAFWTDDTIERPDQIPPIAPPFFTRAAKKGMRSKMIVQTSAVLDGSGRIRDLLIEGAGPARYGLDLVTAETVCRWRFQPAKRGGRAVAVHYMPRVDFEVAPTEGGWKKALGL